MRSLKEYLVEGLADWSDDKLDKKISKQTTKAVIKQEIIEWIMNNTFGRRYKNKLKFDFNTTPVSVNYDGCINMETFITSLTNELFQWGYVSGNFDCRHCNSITSLEGSPEKVGNVFDCSYCKSLKTLEGAPKEVGGSFYCRNCDALTSLEGAPKHVGGWFRCNDCGTKFTEDDVKKVSDVKGKINC
jgi:hypothetical protein